MTNRWTILAVLFLARLSMAFQFQSVAALSPFLAERHDLGLGEIGLLIGLYLAPGLVVALPGGAVAAWFGEKRIVLLGLGLMLLGGLIEMSGGAWGPLIAGRLLAGAGGVIVNIIMTKMLVDWFVGREVSTALAIFINSWPIGIALALLVLPGLASSGGLDLARGAVLGLVVIGFVLVLLVYRRPDGASASVPVLSLRRLPVLSLTCAGLIWALYNAALAMVFSFGAVVLAGQGWSLEAASTATSAFMVVLSVALPLGGILADRTGRRDAIILLSLASYALILAVPAASPLAATILLVIAGALFGLGAGPIMTLPSTVLSPEARNFGMGVFFTIYYAVMMVVPSLAGDLSDRLNDPAVALWLGAAMSGVCIAALALFRWQGASAVE